MLGRPGFYDALREKADAVTGAVQEVLDRRGVPAIAAGRNSFWQLLFMAEEPVNQVDIMNSDTERMKRLGPGTVLEVISDDQVILIDMPAWCRSNGHSFLGSRRDGEEFRLLVRKRADRA